MEVELGGEPDPGVERRSRSPLRLDPARIERGRTTRALDYLAALAHLPELHEGFAELFSRANDAILTPASTGTAPAGLDTTGDPAFARCGPSAGCRDQACRSLQGENGLPSAFRWSAPPRRRQAPAHARWLVAHLAKG